MRKIADLFWTLLVILILVLFVPLFINIRPLEEGEREAIISVFEGSVDVDRVRIKSGGPLTWIYPGVTLGYTISMANDYDLESAKGRALLVHEACHVWQYQHFGLGYIKGHLKEFIMERGGAYEVHFDASKAFRDYDIEEQCEIAAEYYLTGNESYAPYIAEIRAQ